MSTAPPLVERVEAVLISPLAALGLDLEAVEITPTGKRRVLRIAVDTDGGVSLDDVAEATRAVGEALDAVDVMGQQPYTLEVTSRGVDRPLTLERHWRRNADRLVKVDLMGGEALTGRITTSDADSVELDVDGTARTVGFDEVTRALVQIEFNRRRSDVGGPADEPDDPDEDLPDEHDDDEHENEHDDEHDDETDEDD